MDVEFSVVLLCYGICMTFFNSHGWKRVEVQYTRECGGDTRKLCIALLSETTNDSQSPVISAEKISQRWILTIRNQICNFAVDGILRYLYSRGIILKSTSFISLSKAFSKMLRGARSFHSLRSKMLRLII